MIHKGKARHLGLARLLERFEKDLSYSPKASDLPKQRMTFNYPVFKIYILPVSVNRAQKHT